MRQIKIQPLSQQAFRRYGDYICLTDDAALAGASVFSTGFFADVLPLEFGGALFPTVSINSLKRCDRIVRFIEYHRRTCEGILPLDTDIIMFVGLPVMGRLSVEHIEAFYVPRYTFVKLNPLIIHGSVFCVESSGHSMCLLPCRTFANDMEMKRLNGDEVFELVP